MKKNVLIAVTVIASLCLLYWGIEFLKGVNMFKPANFYYAKFERVNGLVEAAPVMVNGFQVGQVREITYDYATNQISVMMAMNRELHIPVGSSVSVVSSLTGASTLALEMATTEQYYKVGDEIPGVVPHSLMDRVQTEIMPQVSGILPKVDSIMGGVNDIVADPALKVSIARLDAITQQLAQSAQQLNQLMASLNKSVPGVMNNVNGITSNLADASGNINHFSGNLQTLPIDSTLNQVNATVANLQALTAKLNDPNSSLGLLLNDRSLYNNANRTISDLDSLFIDIKANPKRYINVKVF
ncbi:MAG: MCE family protein [Muribaculaceae bacterium]|nr:MCE family protein [Muribaculaceae bacterium]